MLVAALALTALQPAMAAAVPGKTVQGKVVDLNGFALNQAMVTFTKLPTEQGPTAVTVFTAEDGTFAATTSSASKPTAQKLGFRIVGAVPHQAGEGVAWTIIMRNDANQAGIAPASAWLANLADPKDKYALVHQCVSCHQLPAPEVRTYAKMIHDTPTSDPAAARVQSWHASVEYMNYLSAREFARGGDGPVAEENRVYTGGAPGPTSALLARTLTGPMDRLEGYSYNAPLLVNSKTVIREYEVPRPNAIREAVTLDDPSKLWVADVNSNNVVRVDADTGETRAFQIPAQRAVGPHTLNRGKDGSLWVAPLFNGVVARLNPKTEKWDTWELLKVNGLHSGIHDFTIDTDYVVVTDKRGRVWYSDIMNNAVGWLDPKTGKSGIYPIPPVPGRVGNETVYGIAMSPDRVHIWYAQLGIGCFGSFNTETLKFETVVQMPDPGAGPRRMTMSNEGVLYVPMYNVSQLAEYDTRTGSMIGVYDLPDRASAPYGIVWDPLRKVVWIATSNANAIYRFDPKDKSFSVLPLPREGAFLRMVAVDNSTGQLVTSYANIVENVHGPRMALLIDVGDGVGMPKQRAGKKQAGKRTSK